MVRQDSIIPATLGINAVAIPAGTTIASTTFDASGFNQLTIEVDLVWAAATDIRLSIFIRESATVPWKSLQSVEGAGLGVYNSYPYVLTQPVAASESWAWNLPINAKLVYLSFTSLNGTTDTLTALARLGVV